MHRTVRDEYVGYTIDYMREVAQLANLDLHFVPADSELDAQRLFAEGRVDIYPGLCPSPERRATYLFSRLSTGCMTGTILVRENDTRFAHEDWATLGRVRVGVEAFNPHIKLFRDKCTSQNINPECVQYNGVPALIHALEAGEVDAIVVNDFWSSARTRCIARFAPHPVYVATLASRPDIMARINEALEQIAIHQPGFASSLYIRYFQSGSEERPLFTRDELAFLATKPRLRVAYESGRQPIIAADPETGQIQGIVADIYRQIEAFSGLEFEFVCLQETEALREMAKGRVDLLAFVLKDPHRLEQADLVASQPFLVTPMVLVTRRNGGPVRRLGLRQGYATSSVFASRHRAQSVFFESMEACTSALLAGRIDAFYTNLPNAFDLQRSNPVLKITPLNDDIVSLSCAAPASLDPRVLSIINRCIQHISAGQMDAMLLDNTAASGPVTVRLFVWHNLGLVLAGGFAIMASIVLLVWYIMHVRTQSSRRIQELLFVDPVSGLGNLNMFYREALALVQNNPHRQHALVCLDIVHFRHVNYQFGYEAGNRVLTAMGRRLRAWTGSGECCARLSGGLFACCLATRDWRELEGRLQALGEDFGRSCREQKFDSSVRLVAGIALVQNLKTPLYRWLDLANYARREVLRKPGRSFLVYNRRMQHEQQRRKTLEERLELAVRHREFVPFFQPKVNMLDGSLVGSEALARWQHPGEGLVGPAHFIPVFEASGTIDKVDFCIYEGVCRCLQEWRQQGLQVRPVSCNFSAISFRRANFVQRIVETADRYGIPRNLLELELTESAFTNNAQVLASRMRKLTEEGFAISVDDFGCGYSSLGQLQHLRPQILKLDRSFISNGLSTQQARLILSAVISLAKGLDVDLVCEGVETREQIEALIALGCQVGQGFYYARPMPAEDFARILEKGFLK